MTLALKQAETQRDTYKAQKDMRREANRIADVAAPRDGWVINPPHIDEVGKYFDHSQPTAFCTIGDPDQPARADAGQAF